MWPAKIGNLVLHQQGEFNKDCTVHRDLIKPPLLLLRRSGKISAFVQWYNRFAHLSVIFEPAKRIESQRTKYMFRLLLSEYIGVTKTFHSITQHQQSDTPEELCCPLTQEMTLQEYLSAAMQTAHAFRLQPNPPTYASLILHYHIENTLNAKKSK